MLLFVYANATAQSINDTIQFKAHVFYFFSGRAVEGALVRTSADTTITDAKGFFRIKVSKRDTVFVWYPGYKTIKAPIRTFGGIENFYLKEDDRTMLDEVTVTKQRDFYLKKYVPQDTIKMYTVREDNRIKTGADRNYMKDVPLGTGMVSELAALFSKKEKERRKMLDILADEHYTATYWKVLGNPELQKDFMNTYGLTEEEFIDYKLHFHQRNTYLHTVSDESKIRQAFYNQYLSYLRYYKYQVDRE